MSSYVISNGSRAMQHYSRCYDGDVPPKFQISSGIAPFAMAGQTLTNLLRMLEAGRDNALLRFSLGNEYLKEGNSQAAVEHLRAAVKHDPAYSAAWKLLGRALEATHALNEALQAYREGIAVAERKGDKQASKEMTVFAKRIERKLADAAS
jgi:predicted Zn-dependent protease